MNRVLFNRYLKYISGQYQSRSNRHDGFKDLYSNKSLWYWTRKYSNSSFKQTPRLRPIKTNSRLMKGAFLFLAIPVGTFCLGTWQIYRRGWKLNLIQELEDKTSRAPVPLPEDLAEVTSMEFVPVTVSGKFDHEREFFLGPRANILSEKTAQLTLPQNKIGFMVITPFILSDRPETILVNRGWVNKKMKDPRSRLSGQVEGEVEITGCVRLGEKHNFGDAALAEKNTFMWRDLERMARYVDTSTVYVDCDYNCSVDGGPIGGQTRKTLRNEHMSYIFTWYSLSIVTGVLWFYKFKRPPLPDAARVYNMYKDHR